MKVNI